MAKAQKLLSPIHPGPILRTEFTEPFRLSMNRLALDLRVPVTWIAEIVHGRRGITPDTALRLARYFNTSAGFRLNLKTAYDLEVAQDKLGRTIEKEVPLAAGSGREFPCLTNVWSLTDSRSSRVLEFLAPAGWRYGQGC